MFCTVYAPLQEHARDSFENLLFSLCRFHEITGRYPARITAVSYTLKQKRFEQLHRAAVRFPAGAFSFVGTEVSSCPLAPLADMVVWDGVLWVYPVGGAIVCGMAVIQRRTCTHEADGRLQAWGWYHPGYVQHRTCW